MKKIPPFKLVPQPMNDEARELPGFRWAAPHVGKRHQLGGDPPPEFDPAEWPRCPECDEPMIFYGQLDSINDEYCIADAGLICVFACIGCVEVRSLIVST